MSYLVLVLKAMPEIFLPLLLKLFEKCLELRKIPEDLKKLLQPHSIKSGDRNQMDNYRAISVLKPIS